jgi:hypothetical protein
MEVILYIVCLLCVQLDGMVLTKIARQNYGWLKVFHIYDRRLSSRKKTLRFGFNITNEDTYSILLVVMENKINIIC